MTDRSWWLVLAGGLAVLALIAWSFSRMSPRPAPAATGVRSSAPTVPPTEAARIAATLFFGAADGQGLVSVRRDVPLADSTVEQGRHILNAQLTELPPEGAVSVIPPGTTLRAFYITDRGDAFVDLSPEVVSGHPGGSLGELLTVQAIVNAVAANLTAAARVQILVDGKEVDTLAGHVDLRRPLAPDPSIVQGPDGK
jgi:hypothetical protein